MSDEEKHLVRAGEIDWLEFRHPLNERSTMQARLISRGTGLTRLGISVATLPPGGESFVCHSHEAEEEFIYVISGRGRLRLRDGETEEQLEIGPGDFMGFPTPSLAHQLLNPFDEDLVYVMGGESMPMEVAEFPDLGKRLYRHPGGLDVVDVRDVAPLFPAAGDDPPDP